MSIKYIPPISWIENCIRKNVDFYVLLLDSVAVGVVVHKKIYKDGNLKFKMQRNV